MRQKLLLWTDRQTEGRTDKQTDIQGQNSISTSHSEWGYNNLFSAISKHMYSLALRKALVTGP